MSDYLVRAITADGLIRAFAAVSTQMAGEAHRRHDTWPVVTAALGRTLTAAALLSATLKSEGESLTVRVAGDGPIGGVTCDADALGNVRGYVREPHVDLDLQSGKLDVAGAVGKGYVHVTRQLAVEGIYTGTSEIISGEIAEDITYYLTKSEQTPSAVGLGVRVTPEGEVTAAGGYMLQLMPSAATEAREQLEVNLRALGAISLAVEQGLTPEEILGSLLAGLPYKLLERRDLRFSCRCSRQRALSTLATIDPAELARMIEEDGGAEMTCHFCGEVFRFSEGELRSGAQEH